MMWMMALSVLGILLGLFVWKRRESRESTIPTGMLHPGMCYGFSTYDYHADRGHASLDGVSLSLCIGCQRAKARHTALFADGGHNPGWTLTYGGHTGTKMSRDLGPKISGLKSLDECRRRAEKIKICMHLQGSKLWFATAISPDDRYLPFSDLSEHYR